jgi:hypothetical protein
MRGIKADGSPLDLNREYIRSGIRSIAEDLCTGQIGHRNQVDAMTAERHEIQECRYTSLDRMINRANAAGQVNGSDDASHFIVRRNVNGDDRGEFAKIREQHIAARLIALQKMGLAEEAASGEWRVRRDFEAFCGLCSVPGIARRCSPRMAHSYPTSVCNLSSWTSGR